MDILLIVAVSYLLYTVAVFVRNLFEFRSLNECNKSLEDEPFVSVCIPARNEENVIERCVRSVLNQNYTNFEVIVLDDNSTDATPDLLSTLGSKNKALRVINGEPKPDDWLGKPWACQQLGNASRGEIILFIDADVWLEPSAVFKAAQALKRSDVITVWPKQEIKTFWEKLIIPMIYYGLYSLLPAKYVEENPKWVPKPFRKQAGVQFAAACGQFIGFNRQAYKKIGGHSSVKQQIVEDVELAKVVKRNDLRITMFDGIDTVNCRMYTSHHEIFEGLRKNFFVGFGRNIVLFLFMAIMQFIVYIAPVYILAFGEPHQQLTAAALLGLILLQRWVLDLKFGWNPLMSILQPLTILWFEVLGIRCLWDHYTGKKATWKGREV
ncbi:glycosyltransferase [Gracilimonas amylolytica]|uniref:glycosyltransferase n=1 Tax=Gracilimonas amylolytica TaxID=1749045 RepID=UPI000CD7FF50|nr:glycosyltransferase family 2 protein [Gracilimonas amylolytica]